MRENGIMKQEIKITGVMLQSYIICKRQLWFFSRQIVPDQKNPYIEIGRLIDEMSYQRERKKIHFEDFVIDIVKKKGSSLVIAEVKKTSKAKESALMQLAFYLYRLKQNGILATGELLFPKERRKQKVVLTEELEEKVLKALNEIAKILATPNAPKPEKQKYCTKCGYREFCWA